MRIRHIVICALPGLPYFPTLSHKRHDFRMKKVVEHQMFVLISAQIVVRNISLSTKQ
jgi:hypothetical protein